MNKAEYLEHKKHPKVVYWKNKGGLKCPHCRSTRLRKDGIVKKKQRYFCKSCGCRTIAIKGRPR